MKKKEEMEESDESVDEDPPVIPKDEDQPILAPPVIPEELRNIIPHLAMTKKEYEDINEITSVEDSLLLNSRTVLSKMKTAMKYRSTQADVVRQILDDSPYPKILCADLNDIPNSYTYFTIRGEMQDAFLEKGFGIGRTFSSLSPTLRIDYVFTDPNFTIKQFTRVVKSLSDHYLLLVDLEMKK